MEKHKLKIFVGLSGGVDSSVAAALLVEQGFEVVGVFMQNWSSDFAGCCNLERDVADARAVANQLGIKFYVWNFEREYREKVLEYFFTEYQSGRTPNPDVMCNREIKFKLFLDRALKLGADKIATGHYARIVEDEAGAHLLKNLDITKDQSYFLCQLTQYQLKHAIFPLGDYYKSQVRDLALKFNLPTATKKDSQGICFVGQIDIRKFLQENIKTTPGKIINTRGEEVGDHEGLAFYTIGQRKEIGNLPGGPYYVVAKNLINNNLVISADPHDKLLWREACIIDNLSWTNKIINLPDNYDVVIRYHHAPVKAGLEKLDDNKIKINFAEPQRAVTAGQLAAIFAGDEPVGSGVIGDVL